MGGIEFEVSGRKKGRMMTTIRAHTKEPVRDVALYLDNLTGEVLYPISIKSAASAVVFMLESDSLSSCSLPPSISDDEVDGFIAYLGTFHEVIAAARRLIRKEQRLMQADDEKER